MKHNLSKRILSLLLAAVMLLGLAVPVNAADHRHTHATSVRFQETKASADMPMLGAAEVPEEEAPEYEDTDMVRVSIILDKESTLQAGFSTMDIATNEEAMSYRGELAQEQTAITGSIEKALGAKLDVQWNLTLAANLISANVAYGDIATIEKVEGVAQVILETLYEPDVVKGGDDTAEPNTGNTIWQVGAAIAWENGYTGAGSRVAVIDTGIDLDHQSFSSKGFEYSLKLNAEKAGMSYEDYVASLDLLDKEEILSVADKLNIPNLDVDKAYNTTKVPFGYNYIDVNYRVVHDYDGQGSHGSHVEGIAAANAYLPQRDGSFVSAAETVGVVGVAPDAQIISMKVFGVNGGAYASDYMAAIEDAIILGCDSVNLSLGSAAPGFAYTDTYEELMNSLQQTDTVVTMSGGNSYHWFNRVTGSKLFVEDIRFHTGGSPGSYSNSLAVASVDNAGYESDYENEEIRYQVMSTFSSWGVPESLELKPEITAPGGNINSVNGDTIGGKSYELMSGTSMAAPQMAGAAAVMAEYIRANNLTEKTGLTVRQLSQSLMMSTALPLYEGSMDYYYPVLRQGAGLVQLDDAVRANAYIMMDEDATAYAADGKVKAELGDDPERTGVYNFGFTINNFSEKDTTYRMSTELFTQASDGTNLLQFTNPMTANVTYKIDGATYVPEVVGVDCDLNADGKTDAADAQIILDYCAGLTAEIDAIADVDASGAVNTYDAHLLLAGLQTGEFTVPAGKSVAVQVCAELTSQQKAILDSTYPNGAYVEGYVFVNPAEDAEGNLCDSVHSIPVLGFYGNWTDPSMFGVTYAEQLYGDTRKAYTGATQNNNLVINRDGESFFQVGNPYKVETSYPAGREAVRSTDILESYNSMLIRNAAAMVVLIEDEAGNLLHSTALNTMLAGAYYYVNGGAWRNTDSSQLIGRMVSDLGLKEGDRFTVTTVAIPEYYALGEILTLERVREIMASGVLGEGAYLRTEMVVDDTAPEVIAISRDIENQNRLIVNVKDNQQVAAMSLVKLDGSKTYTTILPETFGEPGTMQVFTLDLTGIKAGEKCLLVLGDYAGNERTYEVTLNLEEDDDGGEGGGDEPNPDDVNSNFFGYSVLSGNVWMNADLDYANYANVGGSNVDVVAAEYVDGYVYTVGTDNKLYVAPHGNWSGATYLSDCSAYGIEDMAFNYADNKLYALGAGNIIYTVDLMTGELTEQFYVTITNPKAKTDEAYKLRALAISDDGTFYVVNDGDNYSFASFLYSFTLDMVVDGAVKELQVKSKSAYIIGYNQGGATLAWDHDDDRLYYYGKYSNPTGLSALDYPGWFNLSTYKYSSSGMNHKKGFMAMYFTAPDVGVVPETDVVESFTINPTEMKMVVGSSAQIATSLKPWNLKDQSLTWETSDASVVTVTDGLLTALKKGAATVTVTTNAAPYIQYKIEVTVGDLPDVNLNAYLQDEDGNSLWVNFNSLDVENWQIIAEAASDSLGGVILNDTLYYHNRSYVYAADPDTFEAEAIFEVGVKKSTENCYYDWPSAAPAELTEDGYFDRLIMPVEDGTVLTILNPHENRMVDLDISHLGKLALITTVGFERTTVVSEKSGATYENCPQYIFYGIAESGNIYELKLAAYPDETDDGINEASYQLTTKPMGISNLKLANVANATTTNSGGLVYDPVSGCLVLLHYADGDSTARLYAVVPESGATLELGTVRDAVWPAYSLYQYTAPTEMTLRVRQSVLNLVEGDDAQINASVAPAQDYTGGVTFVSNDPTIATVDENGLVVGVKAGVTTITVSTEDNSLSKEVTVNVEAAMKVDLTVNAKLDLVEEGSNWVVIDTKDITNPTIRAYDHSYMKIGGVHNGKIYGGDGSWYMAADMDTVTDLVMVEPEYDYEATFIAYMDPNNIIYDLTTMPAYELAYTDADGNPATITAGDMPIFVDINENIYMFNQEEMNLRGWALFGEFDGVPGAMDFLGMTTVTEEGVEYPAYSYAVLTTSGVLYNFIVVPRVELNDGVATVKYSATVEEVGNVGLRFNFAANMGMVYVNDGTNLGLLISYNDKRPELYYVEISLDMLEVEYNAGKIGSIPGANFIGVLHFDSALNLSEEAPNLVSGQIETIEATDIRNSGKVTVSGNNEADAAMAMVAVEEAEEIRNNSTFVPGDGTIAIELTEEVAASNGILEVSYDPAVLTYVDTTSTNLVAVNAGEGKVLVAYASGRELPAGSALATVNFTFAGEYIE
ncbi:MAG: hypothetical protein E7459_03300, partial [Ruminococcaceae bacterium]|nr:hypothetical protein [Oscillospiraceae bacterium]